MMTEFRLKLTINFIFQNNNDLKFTWLECKADL